MGAGRKPATRCRWVLRRGIPGRTHHWFILDGLLRVLLCARGLGCEAHRPTGRDRPRNERTARSSMAWGGSHDLRRDAERRHRSSG